MPAPVGSPYLQSLITARRLHTLAQRHEARRMGKDDGKTAKDDLAEDEALLSGRARAKVEKAEAVAAPTALPDDQRLRLGDLRRRLHDIAPRPAIPGEPPARTATVAAATRTETEIVFELQALEPVDGLVVRHRQRAETDRYCFDFTDGATVRITDKWSGKSTTIWGDLTSTLPIRKGRSTATLKDLQASNLHTTFMLEDGTRLTFTARDDGVIRQVDIFKGAQHLRGHGAESAEWADEARRFFAPAVDADAAALASSVPRGDTVFAGGDGNDWFDAAGRLVWGQQTGPRPVQRPAFAAQMTVRQTTQQVALAQVVDREA